MLNWLPSLSRCGWGAGVRHCSSWCSTSTTIHCTSPCPCVHVWAELRTQLTVEIEIIKSAREKRPRGRRWRGSGADTRMRDSGSTRRGGAGREARDPGTPHRIAHRTATPSEASPRSEARLGSARQHSAGSMRELLRTAILNDPDTASSDQRARPGQQHSLPASSPAAHCDPR